MPNKLFTMIDYDSDDDIIIVKKPKIFILEKQAKEEMKKHGLVGWTFEWNLRCTRKAGCCIYDTKTIEITKAYALKATKEEYKNTILHEIAHALVGYKNGHNKIWKSKAISIGCNGERCHNVTFTEPKYTMTCGCKDKIRKRMKLCSFVENVKRGKIGCTICKKKIVLN